jgi:putative membrane protein insertion efficiency factor
MPTSSVNSKDRLRPQSAASNLGSGAARVCLLALISAYRVVVRPVVGPACRFAPSCSTYAERAIRLHGPLIGCRFALRRLLHCHPWNPGGYDPVPKRSR